MGRDNFGKYSTTNSRDTTQKTVRYTDVLSTKLSYNYIANDIF